MAGSCGGRPAAARARTARAVSHTGEMQDCSQVRSPVMEFKELQGLEAPANRVAGPPR